MPIVVGDAGVGVLLESRKCSTSQGFTQVGVGTHRVVGRVELGGGSLGTGWTKGKEADEELTGGKCGRRLKEEV